MQQRDHGGSGGETSRPAHVAPFVLWATPAQVARLRALMREMGDPEARQVLKSFSGGSHLADVARFMTAREAEALILLFTVLNRDSVVAAVGEES